MADVLARALAQAGRSYPASRTFQNTFMRGARAARAGASIDSCPYARRRGDTSWRARYRSAWIAGHVFVTTS